MVPVLSFSSVPALIVPGHAVPGLVEYETAPVQGSLGEMGRNWAIGAMYTSGSSVPG